MFLFTCLAYLTQLCASPWHCCLSTTLRFHCTSWKTGRYCVGRVGDSGLSCASRTASCHHWSFPHLLKIPWPRSAWPGSSRRGRPRFLRSYLLTLHWPGWAPPALDSLGSDYLRRCGFILRKLTNLKQRLGYCLRLRKCLEKYSCSRFLWAECHQLGGHPLTAPDIPGRSALGKSERLYEFTWPKVC